MRHKRRNRCATNNNDDNFWKDIRENFVELRKSMNYITQWNEKLKLQEQTRKNQIAQSIASQVDCPTFEDDQSNEDERNDPSAKKEGFNEMALQGELKIRGQIFLKKGRMISK